VGDGHWHVLRSVEDLDELLGELERDWHFRMVARPGKTIDQLWDSRRAKLLFSFHPRTEKIAISAGSTELRDPKLLTLAGGSLEDVRKANADHLHKEAASLVAMLRYLSNLGKQVMLLLPPYGEDAIEVFNHWEDIILEETQDLVAMGSLRVINLPAVM